jgi:DNA mismatch repair protein MutL
MGNPFHIISCISRRMPRIHQLDPHVVNKIAAGEVIERPASVVKELLENSLDALATRIEVDVSQGGSELIRVADDGEGVHADDLPLSVASHATSKIGAAEDLERVRTMGFRGEALASIAAVSRFRLQSRTADDQTGHEIELLGGRPSPVKPCGCPVGTVVEVRQLFFNTPARRKFLKTTATEFGHVSEQFTRVAIAHPRLHAALRHNGKAVYELPPTDRLIERLELFFGKSLAEQLIWVESETEAGRLWGYVGHPSQNRSSRKGQYLYLNGRWITDRSLQHALGEAYRGMMMVGRYPVAFLFLEMPPDQVDVNVHPTKCEVRFRDSQQPYRQLLSTLRTKFLGMGMELDSKMTLGSRPADGPRLQPPAPDRQRQLELEDQLATWAKGALAEQVASHSSHQDPDRPQIGPGGLWTQPLVEPAEDESDPSNQSTDNEPRTTDNGSELAPRPSPLAPPPKLRVMQVLDCYLVVDSGDGLMVIDQHALHERVMYEHLRGRVLAGAVESQRLLVPRPVELSPREAALVLDNEEVLRQLGFGVQEFGQSTVLLTAYPAMLSRVEPDRLLRDVADQIAGGGKTPSRRDLLDSLLHMMSCKAAIKAGQRLQPEEMESLLAQRHLIDDAHHCPHGRPTALVLTRDELDRQFGRLG